MTQGRIEWLDMMRGMAAIVVVLYHFNVYLDIPWLTFGAQAVDIFFGLSGVVLALKYAEEIERGMTFAQFASARLRRLYPMIFIAACFVIGLNAAGVPEAFSESNRFGWMLFLVLPLPGHWPLGASFPGNTPMWSLWAELVINVIWFPIMRSGRRFMPVLTVLCLIALGAQAWHHKTLNDGFQQGIPMMAFALLRALTWFCVGYCIAFTERKPLLSTPWAVLALTLCLVAMGCGATKFWAMQMVTVVVGLILLHALLQARAPSKGVASVANRLGLVSFPMYLIHLPAGRLLHYVDTRIGHWPALALIMGGATVTATHLNEAVVARIQQWHRRRTVPRQRSQVLSSLVPAEASDSKI